MKTRGLWMIVFLVFFLLLVFFLWKGSFEAYEVGKNEEYRFLYYTDDADFFSDGKLSLESLYKAHSTEFPLAWLHQYYAIHFDQCEALYKDRKSLPFPASYVEDLYEVWKRLEAPYKTKKRILVWYPRDRVERFTFPILVKSRVMVQEGNRGSILMKLNTVRHYDRMLTVMKKKAKEASFRQKIPQVVWRGAPTGSGFKNNIPPRSVSRETLLENHCHSNSPLINVGLVVKKPNHAVWKKYEKEEMSLETMLQYKYLLSVEGNDVATNLKWILASNSLVVMPRPQISSWLIEDALLPYVHYLPVRDDFSDLESQIIWAEKHTKKCEKMIANAHRYLEPFLDEAKEMKLQMNMLKYYLDHFRWE